MSGIHLTHPQAKELTRFLHELRPDWDKPGIEYHLGQARSRASVHDLAVAAIKAASDHRNRTPAVIGLDGPHWRTSTVDSSPRPVPLAAHERCSICSRGRAECQQLSALTDDGHPFSPRISEPSSIDPTTGEISKPNPVAIQKARDAITEMSAP